MKEDPKTEKPSIKTSRNCPTMSEKMDNIQRWKVAGALHRPKGIRLKANVPKGHVKVVFSWSAGKTGT